MQAVRNDTLAIARKWASMHCLRQDLSKASGIGRGHSIVYSLLCTNSGWFENGHASNELHRTLSMEMLEYMNRKVLVFKSSGN